MSEQNLRIANTTKPYLFQNDFIMKDLPVEDLKLLQLKGETMKGKRGDVLFRQGGFPKSVIWLISGMAKIFQETKSGQRHTLYIYSDGDLIGYRQLIAEEANPVSCILLEDASYILISAEVFRALLISSPFFTRNVLSALAGEFSVWMNRMTVFNTFPVRQRLVMALLILHEQYRISGSPHGVITMTRTDLAEYVGATLETVVRVLNVLKNDHLVHIQGRRIHLRDTGSLMDILQKEEI